MDKNLPPYRIGAAAQKTGLSVHAIRFYEKAGLIHHPARSEGGFRAYSQAAIDQILFIRKAQSFGLTLREIKQIMRCGDKGLEPCCALVTKIFEAKIGEFETKIDDLQKMKRRLKSLLADWTKK